MPVPEPTASPNNAHPSAARPQPRKGPKPRKNPQPGKSPQPGKPTPPQPEEETVTLKLSTEQIKRVVQLASEGEATSARTSGSEPEDPRQTHPRASLQRRCISHLEDERLSQSLLRGMLILACFFAEDSEQGVAQLAEHLQMNTSTIYRYVTTLMAVGLVERNPATRKYRLVVGR
jgi:hypothetical protein